VLELWFKQAVIYCLQVETFADSNGDGVGDFPGLCERLDYLAGLGVTCLWLLPFYPTPGRDNGYDIADYYGIDPRLGTLGNFVELAHRARDRGIRVMIDLVVNHTSIDHPWFQAARLDPRSPYRDYYIWSKAKPEHADDGVVFPGVQRAIWTYDKAAKAYYYHRFYDHQADLNMDNPAVREEIRQIMGFWLQLGVSGFRVDAAPFLLYTQGNPTVHAEDPYQYLTEMREFLAWRNRDAILLAEANVPMTEIAKYFGEGTRFHVVFNFLLNQYAFLALAREQAAPIREALLAAPRLPRMGQWANFLRNHDELDLGRLSDQDRQHVFAAFGPDAGMQLYERGIRRRLLPMLSGDERHARLAYSLMFSLPGTPVLWYGDEIGMGDELRLPERLGVRTPMQWSAEENGGFSTAPRQRLIRPLVEKGAYGYRRRNVANQRRDLTSMLNWMERLIRVRKECHEIGAGTCHLMAIDDPAILAYCHELDGGQVVVVHNLSRKPRTLKLDLADRGARGIIDLLGDQPYAPLDGARHDLELEGYGYRWFRVDAIRH
jgi:maltose alpha-D-glucosyltransferase / alpha-amylase